MLFFRHILYTFEVHFNIFKFIRKIVIITYNFDIILFISRISNFYYARRKFQYTDFQIAK